MTKASLTLPLFLLHCIGLDPQRNNNFALFRKMFSLTLVLLINLLVLAELLFNYKGFDTVIRCFEGFGHTFQALNQFICMWIKRDAIRDILEMARHFWPLGHSGPAIEQQMKRIHLFADRYSKFFIISTTFAIIPYAVTVFHGDSMIATYLENDETAPVWYKTFITIIQLPVLVVVITIYCAFNSLFFFLVVHGLSELKNIKHSFRALQKLDDKRQQRFKLMETIQHHIQVLDYFKQMNDIFSFALLTMYLATLISLCFGLILLSNDGLSTDLDRASEYLSNVVLYALQAWAFSYLGNLIIDWSLEIPNEIFYTLYGGDVETNHWNILMMICRAQNPALISVGGFVNCDLQTFAQVNTALVSGLMKSSMSVFTFVNTVKEQS